MPITEKEWDAITETFSSEDVREQIDNAIGSEMYQAIYALYVKARNVINPWEGSFTDETNEMLVSLVEDAEELEFVVNEAIEALESVQNMLSRLTKAIPESIYEEAD